MSEEKNAKEYYLGNENLPSQHARHEYSADKVREIKKSKKNLLHFAQNYFYIINIDTGREVISLRPYQKRILRKMRDGRFVIVMSSRQSGKTTMMTAYALWVACFNTDQKIVLVANKEQTAKDIFGRVRLAYEELPNWIKPGVVEYGKESMVLANGSRIGISTTTGTAARGMSCNVLILDELAFIEPHIVDEFWKSVYPTISSSKKSKIFICSTPNGTDNLFYKLYTGASKGTNGWVHDRVTWDQVPGRDEQWKEDNIKLLGSKEAFDQEFGCEFLQSGENIIDEQLMLRMSSTCREPKHILDGGEYKIWTDPEADRIYVVGVDISEGVGKAASCAQVFDITNPGSIEQVATYHSNTISPYNFTDKLNDILKHWGSPPALIERNNCGSQVVDLLSKSYNYNNIVTYTGNIKSKGRIGVIAHTNTKYRGVINMRYWFNESRSVIVRDTNLVKELQTFIRHSNGTWGHIKSDGIYDDRVMSTIWALFILNEDIVSNYFDVIQSHPTGKPIVLGEPLYTIDSQLQSPFSQESVGVVFGNINIGDVMNDIVDDTHGGISDLQNSGWELY